MTTVKKQRIQCLLIAAFFIQFIVSSGAQINLSGIVKSEKGEPLPFVLLTFDDLVTQTDDNGKYTVSLSPNKSYRVEATLVGFKKIKTSYATGNANATFDLSMAEEVLLLNTATVTAGKYEKPLSEVTVSLDILRPQLVENVNTRKMDDVLQKVPGVNIIDGQPNIRGGSGWSYGAGSRVLILVDDIPALQADAGFPNWRDFPVENVAAIEVVKGAASALYGSSAMNGIINIRTGYATSTPETKISTFGVAYFSPKDPQKKWWGDGRRTTDLAYQPPFPYEAGVSLLHKQKIDRFDLVASGFYINAALPNHQNYDRYGRVTLNTRYRITDKINFGVNVNYNRGFNQSFFYWENDSTGAHRAADGTISSSQRERYWIDPFLNISDEKGNKHKILSRFYNVNNGVNNNQSNGSRLFYAEYQYQRVFLEKITFTAGAVGTFNRTEASLYSDTIFKSRNLATYAQADAKFGKLNLSLGARLEQNTIIGPSSVILSGLVRRDTVASPNGGKFREARPVFRFGANYQVAKATYLRASVGQGYRFPTVAEMFISTAAGGLPIIPNPELTSETGWTGEIAAKQGFALGGFNGFVDGAFFISEYNNMLEFQPRLSPDGTVIDLAFQSQNIGNTRIAGFEISVAAQGKVGNVTPSVLMGYTYIDPRYQNFSARDSLLSSSTENVLKYRFLHNFKFDGELAYKNFAVGASVIYTSRMIAVDNVLERFLPGVQRYRAANLGGATVFDLRASYKFADKLKVSVIGSNLLNTEYSNRPGLLEAPRHAQVRFDYSF